VKQPKIFYSLMFDVTHVSYDHVYSKSKAVYQRWAWTGSGAGSEPDFDLFWPDRIAAGLGFSVASDRSRIVMFRVCQLKYAMSYVTAVRLLRT